MPKGFKQVECGVCKQLASINSAASVFECDGCGASFELVHPSHGAPRAREWKQRKKRDPAIGGGA